MYSFSEMRIGAVLAIDTCPLSLIPPWQQRLHPTIGRVATLQPRSSKERTVKLGKASDTAVEMGLQ
ncbi:MAG TPA: hypothetical protein VKB34_22130 [Povalibacter sp.]|nr:hypothetical protein [Povalibacter sp.]